MKKIIVVLTAVFVSLLVSGCGLSKDNIVQKLTNKINKLDSYHISGNLEVTNNETTYKYDIDVSYKDDEKYRVSLKNKTNDHEQIILKNSSGVYVLTPSLNKSFKFQSEWPYNNSQSYLYQTLLNDIENDENKKIESNGSGYIITTKVNYANNKELTNQKIYLDKNANITKVEVLNDEGIVKIKMIFSKTDYSPSLDDNYFEISQNMETKDTKSTNKEIDSVIYPLYIPNDTYLDSEETIMQNDIERTILTFKGDSPFTIIEEPVNVDDDITTTPVYGELEFINDAIGSIGDGTVTWISDGIEYYAVSNALNDSELLQVANSVSAIAISK